MHYYPYDEGQAGEFRGKGKTADSSEYLQASKEIIVLARAVLSEDEYSEAENLAVQLTGAKKEKDQARRRLIEIVKPPPKKPIYYAQHELLYLPRWTRDALRYLGDFIDMLVKSAVYEKTKDSRIFNTSFGPAISQFEKHWPGLAPLADLLNSFNRFLYRGAKHDFTLLPGRKLHRFTSREVVLTAFITMNLATRLTKISVIADQVRHDSPIQIP